MICPKCGNEFNDIDKSCPVCGTSTKKLKKMMKKEASATAAASAALDTSATSKKDPSKKKKVPIPVIIAIIVVVCLVAGAVTFYMYNSHKKDAENQKPKKVTSEAANKKDKGDKTYDFPSISKKLLSEDELDSMSASDLELAENEIYARHGKIFDDEKYKKYFEKKSWYTPKYKAEEFEAKKDSLLNDIEKENLKKIKAQLEYLNSDDDDDDDDSDYESDDNDSLDSSSSSSSSSSTHKYNHPVTEDEAIDILFDTQKYKDEAARIRAESGENLTLSMMGFNEISEKNGKSGRAIKLFINHPTHTETLMWFFVEENGTPYEYDILQGRLIPIS